MKKVFKILGWSLFVVVVVGLFVFLFQKSRKQPDRYAIETVQKTDTIENKSVLTGRIEPRNEVLLKPQLSGIVAEIMHKAGDIVQQGDVIARIAVVPEMMQVTSGESRVRVAEIAFKKAEEQYHRGQELLAKEVIAREEFEAIEAAYKQAKEEVASSREALQIVLTGKSTGTASTSTTLVRATISGMILDVPLKVGNSVIQANTFNDGTTVASIADMNDILFTGKVDETVIGKLQVGMPTYITIGALGKERFAAQIEYIAPKGVDNGGTNYYEIKAAVQLPEGKAIRAGYSANAEVVLKAVYNVLSVPESCLLFEGEKTFVEVVLEEEPNFRTERREIETGVSDGINIEVRKGLKMGEKVRGVKLTDK